MLDIATVFSILTNIECKHVLNAKAKELKEFTPAASPHATTGLETLTSVRGRCAPL